MDTSRAHELLASFLFLRMQVRKSVPEFVLSVKDCKLGLVAKTGLSHVGFLA